jgi:SAM-dependent methyltransferase
MFKRIALASVCLGIALGSTAAVAQQKMLDVPFVPTKYPVVDEMLRLAGVDKGDIVYDLGCGDGRIVITAAQRCGAKGIGFDIDPERIQESQDNAKKAGVTGLVQFFEQDLFTADFHQASVVTLYLLTSVNLKLRPRLLRQLKPGTRVVSHNFGMNEWKPDQSSSVDVDDISHEVYFWIVPANISGTWTWTMGKPALTCELKVDQAFQFPTGTAKINGKPTDVRDMILKGDQVRFVIDAMVQDKVTPMVFEGKAAGHALTGTVKFPSNGKDVVWEWKPKRNPMTEKTIDGEPSKTNPSFSLKTGK